MSIYRFLTKNIVVRRERDTSGNKRSLQATATVDAWNEDLDAEERSLLGIVGRRAWKFWFNPDEDIQEGDVLRDENNNEYRVIEVTPKEIGANQHLEVIAEEYNA